MSEHEIPARAGDLAGQFPGSSVVSCLDEGPSLNSPAGASKPRRASFRVYTEARIAILREGYPRGDTLEALRDACNALPGKPVKSIQTLRTQINTMGITRSPEVFARMKQAQIVIAHAAMRLIRAEAKLAKPPAPRQPAPDRPKGYMAFSPTGAQVQIMHTPKPEALGEYDPTAPGSREARIEKARQMLKRGSAPDVVNSHTRLELHVILRLLGEIREAKRA